MALMTGDHYLLYPLNEFYARASLPLPEAMEIGGEEMPKPYRSLLVHASDMTPTLEGFYKQGIHVRILKRHLSESVYARQVVLALDGDERPVEFGAIQIYLEHFPSKAREFILEAKRPLGAILHNQGIGHTSRPKAFFRINSDAVIGSALQLTSLNRLYGRRNVLLNSSERTLAEIVEILPPLAPERPLVESR
jgi:chorismate-pyruvate lyase